MHEGDVRPCQQFHGPLLEVLGINGPARAIDDALISP